MPTICNCAKLHLCIAVFLVAGCAPKAVKIARDEAKTVYEIQKPITVRTSRDDNRPDWTKRTTYEEDGNIYFTGGFLNGSDYAVTLRCANAEALKTAVQSVSQFVRSEFTEYVQGSNIGPGGIERYVEDGIATFSHNVHIQGLRQSQLYYEEFFSPQGMHSGFHVWVKLEMSKADYLKARTDMLRRLREIFAEEGQPEAKHKAEQLLEELKSGVDNV
ncbi:MAG: hypothetical protein U5L00_07265 [Desulfovermiculus sp.]|nr:hypothetical protein [Desulfovermiculus sp.]